LLIWREATIAHSLISFKVAIWTLIWFAVWKKKCEDNRWKYNIYNGSWIGKKY
jgi:hypothetical protein